MTLEAGPHHQSHDSPKRLSAPARAAEKLAEEGKVLAPERAEDKFLGPEVVHQSSKAPLKIKPPLEETRMELYRDRSDTHTRISHQTSNLIAHGTGLIDGILDGVANGVGEIIETGAFLASKTIYGAKHGWERGKTAANRKK